MSVHKDRYDAENNVISDGTSTYTYDALNHRVRIDGPTTAEYVYHPGGKRASTWDGTPADNLVSSETYLGSTPVAYYTPDAPGSATGSYHWQHQDWLGTERARTNAAGQVEGSYSSLAFGDGYSSTGTDQDASHFTGLDTNPGNGVAANTVHAMFRDYSPTSGNWMSPDPYLASYNLRNPQSLNRYAYVLNNPLSLIDRLGLDPCQNADGSFGDDGLGNTGTLRFPYPCPTDDGFDGDDGDDGGEGGEGGKPNSGGSTGDGDPGGDSVSNFGNPYGDALFSTGVGGAYFGGASNVVGYATAGATVAYGGAFFAPVLGGVATFVSQGIGTYLGVATGSSIAVIGKFADGYTQVANSMGANVFSMPTPLYSTLNLFGQAWTANQAFLDTVLETGQQIYLASPAILENNGAFAEELFYLSSRGIDLGTLPRVP